MSGDRPALRRRLLITSFGAGLLLGPVASVKADGRSDAETFGLAAIEVKNPAGVFLVAIARAGRRLVATGEHGVIIYSDDDGKNWNQAQVPVNVTLTCIGFATPQIGWAAGHSGVILATVDGGLSWQIQMNGVQANALTLAAAQDPEIETSAAPAAPRALRRAEIFLQEGPDKPFLSIFVFNRRKLIAFGAYRMAMITEDGGKSWADWSLHIYDPFSHNIYDAASVGPGIFLAVEEGYAFLSTDGGDSFLPVTSPSNVTLFGAVGAKDGSIIGYGVAGAGFRSTDAGKSWTPLNIATQDNLTAGLVLDGLGLILIGSEAGSVFLSKNNGNSFAQISDVPPMSISAIAQAADGSLVFVGESGVKAVPAAILAS